MKNIWKLYIIFVVLFLFGDIFSTYITIGVKKSSVAEVVKLPEECICTYPPKCDISPIIATSSGDKINWGGSIFWKILGAIIIGILLYLIPLNFAMMVLMLLTQYSIFAIFGNLSLALFPYRFLFLVMGAIVNIILLNNYLEPREKIE